MQNLKKYVLEQAGSRQISQEQAMILLKEISDASKKQDAAGQQIAVIGMACDLPEAENYTEFWENLLAERDCLGYMPDEYIDYYKPVENPYYAEFLGTKPMDIREHRFDSRSSYMKDSDKFDAAFFNIPPREAKYIDPCQRLFLQTAWSAIEDAGYGLDDMQGSDTGVFVGKDHNNSGFYKMITKNDSLSTVGSWESILASRISYIFNFKGPAMVVDTACSSGLMAVHEACLALKSGDCKMAIAGGVSVGGSPAEGKKDPDEAEDALDAVASEDSTVRSFDKKSAGTVFGEGVAAFVLKTLESAVADGDKIYAVIRASASNNDGASNGITAPNPAAQEEVIVKAWNDAGIDPNTISYIETHGTGTLLGDPIEVKALNSAFKRYTNNRQFCGIGSVKSNVGHLVAASGCVGMMKVILSMKSRIIPASINFEEPNPHINFPESAVYVVDKASPWNEEILRAGVSSFGFSGTNVHVVLEDFAENSRADSAGEDDRYVLVLSAKTEGSLGRLVDKYNKFLSAASSVDLKSLCYTASVGRGHYNYRIAIRFHTLEELISKIRKLSYEGLKDHEDLGIRYGYYKVVSDKRTNRSAGEFTESEMRQINIRANNAVKNFADGKDGSGEICDCYIKGAAVNWKEIYRDQKIEKMHLPTYPYEKTRYWADVKVSSVKDADAGEVIGEHPLVERCLIKTINQDVYAVKFSLAKHWILREHVITGKNIIPGTAYIELGREVCSRYIDGDIELKDLVFLTPLAVEPDEEVEAQIVVSKNRDGVSFVIASQKESFDGETVWVTHAEGKAARLTDQGRKEPFDLSVLESDDTIVRSEVHLATLDDTKSIMCFGPRWHNVEHVYISPKALYVHAKLGEEFTEDLKTFKYHTSILDSTINAGIQATLDGVYLPFMFKEIKLYHPLPAEVYSCAVLKDGEKNKTNKETYTYDILLLDAEGKVLVEINDYTVKKVHKFNSYEDRPYYCVKWVLDDRESAEQNLNHVLMFANDSRECSEICKKLESVSNSVIFVSEGREFEKIDESHYKVSADEDAYCQLINAVKDKDIDTIVHAGSFHPSQKCGALEDLGSEMNSGVLSLFYLTKALLKEKMPGDQNIILLTDHASNVCGDRWVNPSNAAYLGFGKCIPQEYSKFKVRAIDAGEDTLADDIIHEIEQDVSDECVALRKGLRYVKELYRIEKDNREAGDDFVFSDGCVMITGGTGGLGLEIGRHLAQKGAKNICLLSRKQIPDSSQWDDILEEGEDEKLCGILSGVKKIQEYGANVEIQSADAADYESMKTVIGALTGAYGKIEGIVHCAGIAGDGFIINKPLDTFKNVLSPKITGTKVLDTLAPWEDIKFFICFSSMTTLFGGPGQSDYTAANAYLDAYSQQGVIEGKPVTAINWPAWSEVGMAVNYRVADEKALFKSVDNSTAEDLLDDIVSYGLTNVIPAEINLDVMASMFDELPMRVSDPIRKAVERQMKKQPRGDFHSSRQHNMQDITIVGKGADEYTDIEKKVACIYASILDLPEIDIFENFNALGGNSMVSTEVLKVLNEYFGDILDVSDMFSYPTVAEMSEYIESKLNPDSAENKEIEQVDDLLEQLETGEIEVDKMIDYFSSNEN